MEFSEETGLELEHVAFGLHMRLAISNNNFPDEAMAVVIALFIKPQI